MHVWRWCKRLEFKIAVAASAHFKVVCQKLFIFYLFLIDFETNLNIYFRRFPYIFLNKSQDFDHAGCMYTLCIYYVYIVYVMCHIYIYI